MSVIRDIFHDVKEHNKLPGNFKLEYKKAENMISLYAIRQSSVLAQFGIETPVIPDNQLVATVKEGEPREILVFLDNDWGTTTGELRKAEREIVEALAASMKKRVPYYESISVELIVDYAFTGEVPKKED